MQTLDKISKFYGTDKSSEIHNYCEKYEKYFPFDRLEPIKILEIGVYDGQSLNTWKHYYPNSIVIGIDIMEKCLMHKNTNNNIWVEIGSQNDAEFLKYVSEKWGPFDMILDDGSHINSDVIFSFLNLFDSVKTGGIYVVEDCSTSYWEEFGGGFRKENTMIEHFKNLIDDVNFNGEYQEIFWNVHARREDYLINQMKEKGINIRFDIESINFLNGIIILTRR
jgi:SAM-dependent methyltransferase